MKVNVNDVAPKFSLYSSEKELINLEDFKGHKVLLLFFPQAFTGVCTKELCATRDGLGTYEDLDAKVLAISVDSVYTLAKFKEVEKLNFPLLSDFNKEVIEMYGCVHETFNPGMKGVAKRSEFVIDKEGIVRYANVKDSPADFPDFDKIKEVLKSID